MTSFCCLLSTCRGLHITQFRDVFRHFPFLTVAQMIRSLQLLHRFIYLSCLCYVNTTNILPIFFIHNPNIFYFFSGTFSFSLFLWHLFFSRVFQHSDRFIFSYFASTLEYHFRLNIYIFFYFFCSFDVNISNKTAGNQAV